MRHPPIPSFCETSAYQRAVANSATCESTSQFELSESTNLPFRSVDRLAADSLLSTVPDATSPIVPAEMFQEIVWKVFQLANSGVHFGLFGAAHADDDRAYLGPGKDKLEGHIGEGILVGQLEMFNVLADLSHSIDCSLQSIAA